MSSVARLKSIAFPNVAKNTRLRNLRKIAGYPSVDNINLHKLKRGCKILTYLFSYIFFSGGPSGIARGGGDERGGGGGSNVRLWGRWWWMGEVVVDGAGVGGGSDRGKLFKISKIKGRQH